MKRMARALGIAAASLLLSGCVIPRTIATLRDERIESGQALVVKQTVVDRMHRFWPSLRIGSVDCSSWTASGMYDNVCSVPVDGRRIPVGVRYDEDRGREVADLLGSVIRTKTLERAIDESVWIAYRLHGRTACGSAPVRVEPVGASVECTLVTRDGRRHDVRLRIAARLTPHTEIAPIAGLHRVAAIARPFGRLDRAFRANPGRLPGPFIAAYLNAGAVPLMQAMQPNLGVGSVQCPRYLNARISTLQAAVADGCWMQTRFGYLQVAVFTGDRGQLDFQDLSRVYDLHKLVTSVERLQERFARTHRGAPVASVDCGADKRIVLTLLSVRYCAVRYSNGRRARLGIEYYDTFEGPQAVVERVPRQG